MLSFSSRRAAALGLVLLNFCTAQNEPSFENIDDPNDYEIGEENLVTPTFNHQLVYPNAPYNTDQNTLKIEYYTEYIAKTQEFWFHVRLVGKIELNTVGANVYMFLGFYDPIATRPYWDYLKCKVDYDGDANANSDPPSRLYSVTDHNSGNKP